MRLSITLHNFTRAHTTTHMHTRIHTPGYHSTQPCTHHPVLPLQPYTLSPLSSSLLLGGEYVRPHDLVRRYPELGIGPAQDVRLGLRVRPPEPRVKAEGDEFRAPPARLHDAGHEGGVVEVHDRAHVEGWIWGERGSE